jgi:hypothetical protein
MRQYPFSFCLNQTYLRIIFIKEDSRFDKCKDTIFKRILQKWKDSTINEYTNLQILRGSASLGQEKRV